MLVYTPINRLQTIIPSGSDACLMRLLVCSLEDIASVNIRDRLLESAEWRAGGGLYGKPVLVHGGDALVTIEERHLFADDIDERVREATGLEIDCVVFLSRHKAASGIPTLTVHPIGNFAQKAEYGGRPGMLVPSAPDLMTSLLRGLQRHAVGLGYQISFEVTHHGPFLRSPTLYLEIGSSEGQWPDVRAGEALSRSLLETEVLKAPKAIGLGGGHYAPRFSEVASKKKVSIGHMISNHFADDASDDDLILAIGKALAASEDAGLVYIHKKSMSRSRVTHLKGLVKRSGAEAIDSSDLEDL
jgi:D-aminoacyl-tRNA deacylase